MAGGIVTTGALPKQFRKDIDEMFDDGLLGVPDEMGGLFTEEAPKGGRYNSYAEISGLEQTRELSESEGPDYVVPEEGNEVTRYFSKYGLAFQATMESLDDEEFGKILGSAKALGKSAALQIQRSAFGLLNGGFGTYKTADGKYIFADDHATLQSADTLDNKGVVDLSETALQAVSEYFDNMKTSTGAPDPQIFKKLLVPTGERWMAQKLMKGMQVLGSANNDILTTNPDNGVMDWSYSVGHYLTDVDAFFAMGDDSGLKISWKRKPALTETGDWETESKMYKVLLRFAVYCNRFQGIYGSTGA